MDPKEEPSRSALEEVTAAAFNGVLLALERRQISIEHFPGPIIVGIVAWPELAQSVEARQQLTHASESGRSAE